MSWRWHALTSLRNKLALLFLAVTALALAVVIFVFLPQLKSRLDDQQLKDLRTVAQQQAPGLGAVIGKRTSEPEIDKLVRQTAGAMEARLTLVGLQLSSPPASPRFWVITDSNESQAPPLDYGLVGTAAVTPVGEPAPAQRSGETGAVAVPLYYSGRPVRIAYFSRHFTDASTFVALARRRLLLASGVALIVALLGGYLVARVMSLRVRRLEVAARDLAAGQHVDPLPVDSSDELGRLTVAFNEMNEQLQRVDRARREFIANASHELRTPIFSLGGFVELLHDDELDEETREEFLQTMAEQVDRLQKLAVDLLDLSRLDAGAIDFTRERVDMTELAGAVVQEFRPAISAHGTAFDMLTSEQPLSALGDRHRAAQIMRILLDNALRHTPEGTAVTVSTDRNNGAVELSVTDRGPGVDAIARSQLFDRFYTGDAARGSGLGLAIAKELAERMGGQIGVQSRPGKTTFTLALPAAEEERG